MINKTRLLGAAISSATATAAFYSTHHTTLMYVFGTLAIIFFLLWYNKFAGDNELKRQARQQIPPSANENKGNQTLEVPPPLED